LTADSRFKVGGELKAESSRLKATADTMMKLPPAAAAEESVNEKIPHFNRGFGLFSGPNKDAPQRSQRKPKWQKRP
jgi:hypothetical protein